MSQYYSSFDIKTLNKLFAILILVSLLGRVEFLSSTFASGLTLFAYTFITLYIFKNVKQGHLMRIQKYPFILILLITLIFSYHITNINFSSLTHLLFLLYSPLILVINMFVLPRHINFDYVLKIVYNASFLLASVGLFMFILNFNGYEIYNQQFFSNTRASSIFGIETPFLTSVYDRPHVTAQILSIGGVAGIIIFDKYKHTWNGLKIVTIIVALYFTHSRTGMVAFFIGFISHIFYKKIGRLGLVTAVLFMYGSILTLIGMFFNIIPSPSEYLIIGFEDRAPQWYGGWMAVKHDAGLFGVGHIDIAHEILLPYLPEHHGASSPANALLHITIQTGLIGGISYFLLTYGLFIKGLVSKNADPRVLIILSSALSSTIYRSDLIFGLFFNASFVALLFGYLIVSMENIKDTNMP